MDHRLPPRHPALPGLVRIDDQARHAIGGPPPRHRKAVRAALVGRPGVARRQLVVDQRGKRLVHPEKERRAQHEAGDDVLPVDREQPLQMQLRRVLGRIVVEPLRIGLDQRAGGRRQLPVAPRRNAVGIEEMPGEIEPRPLLAGNRAGTAAHRRKDLLDVREVVLAVRNRQAIGDIWVRLSKDMRHAPVIPHDADMTGLDGIRRAAPRAQIVPARQPDEHRGCHCAEHQQRPQPYAHVSARPWPPRRP